MKDKEARKAIEDLQLAIDVLTEIVLDGKKDNARFLRDVRERNYRRVNKEY